MHRPLPKHAAQIRTPSRLPSTLTFANAGTQAPALGGSAFTFQAFSTGYGRVALLSHRPPAMLFIEPGHRAGLSF